MIINFQKYLGGTNIVDWAIIELMAHRDERLNLPEWKMKHEGGSLDLEKMEVILTINGVEVDFIALIEKINTQHNQMVREDAKKLLDEKCSDVYEKLNQLKSHIDNIIYEQKEDIDDKILFGAIYRNKTTGVIVKLTTESNGDIGSDFGLEYWQIESIDKSNNFIDTSPYEMDRCKIEQSPEWERIL